MRFALVSLAVVIGALAVFQTSGPVANTSNVGATPVYSSEPFLSGLSFPLNLTFAPDGRMFFNERCGDVRVVSAAGELQPIPFADPGSVHCGGDHGLTGLALDPDFASNHYVYIGYVRQISTSPVSYKPFIERFTDVNGVGTERTMLIDNLPEKSGTLHGLNNIIFGPDGKLYISVGDYGLHASQVAQDLSLPMGKLLRVNKEDGSAPADNPFVSTPGADPRIYAYGLRNSFDFVFHPLNGAIYMTENGPSSCDELNIIVAGGNYEWPHGFDTAANPPAPLGPTCEGGVGIPAVHYFTFFDGYNPWDHNTTSSPVGIIGIDGEQFPALGDSLLVCTFRNTKLRLLQLSPALDDVVQDTSIQEGAAGCLVDVEMSLGGDIYYTSSNHIRRLIIDSDGDGFEDKLDNCPALSNADQLDGDTDGEGDVCDNCPALANTDQLDTDADGDGDVCDNCPALANADQLDSDTDGHGDLCDNCPTASNADQLDTDADGEGDVCDVDDDGDATTDVVEEACGSDPLVAAARPERIDASFAAVDDDGDTQVDEALPAGAANFDCDGDGYKGSAENHVFSYLPPDERRPEDLPGTRYDLP